MDRPIGDRISIADRFPAARMPQQARPRVGSPRSMLLRSIGTMQRARVGNAVSEVRSTSVRSRGIDMAELKGSPRLGQYLKGLRLGYGYSLRKVEEKARSQGGEIDNSQLSRYEKGICYPSFDKLRTLASIFNVSIQTFSDVVDLEELEQHLPAGDDPIALMKEGERAFRLGDYGRAYVHYQKSRSLFEQLGGPTPEGEDAVRLAKARLATAVTLYRMGKISLCEYEIRQLLRLERHIGPDVLVLALMQLCNVHSSFGDLLLAELEAERALDLAQQGDGDKLRANALHALGRIHQQRGAHDAALERYHEALETYRSVGDDHEALKVKVNLGAIYSERGQPLEGKRLLLEARDEARKLGHRWTVASACAWLAEAHFKDEDHETARAYLRESNAVASNGDVQYVDILFLNAYYLWQIARAEQNAAEAKIALGRLKYLRPQLEQDLEEVRAFDLHMERGGVR
jgi:tetratricopeptide (TPR) repeat protein